MTDYNRRKNYPIQCRICDEEIKQGSYKCHLVLMHKEADPMTWDTLNRLAICMLLYGESTDHNVKNRPREFSHLHIRAPVEMALRPLHGNASSTIFEVKTNQLIPLMWTHNPREKKKQNMATKPLCQIRVHLLETLDYRWGIVFASSKCCKMWI